MSAFVPHNNFYRDLATKKHDFSSDVFKVALTNNAPNVATWDEYADITGELANANGYTTGGMTLTGNYVTALADPSEWKLGFTNDPAITAVGGTVGPARYALVYNNTHASKPIVGHWDRGVSDTAQIGDTITFDDDNTNGIIQLTW